MNAKTYKEWWDSIDDYLAHMLMKEGYDHNKVYNIGVTELRAAGEEDKQMTMDEFVEFICRKTGIPYFDRNKIKRNLMKVNSSRQIKSARRPVKSARYIATDPESGEVLGSADTYEEAVNEWGEDVTITDSEVAENVISSYEFNRNIVNSVLSQKMTEQEAIQKIASRKDVNIGFAKQIFNNLMNDKSLISSGTMEMANKINQEFDLNGDLYSWFKDYVGNEGKASTIGGELVRAANQIISEYQENGDGIGYGRGRETVNPAARFIIETCDDYSESRNMSDMLDETDDINYGIWIETFEKTFTDYLRDHEELFHQVNQDDFWSYAETGDKITSVDKFYTSDENGNKYWFIRDENDDLVCTEIEYEEKPIFKVDDVISETDNIADKIDKTEPYGTFEENGFIYSYEADVDDEQGEYDHWVVTDVDRNDLKYHVDDKLNGNDFEYEDIFDENGNEITYRDLF